MAVAGERLQVLEMPEGSAPAPVARGFAQEEAQQTILLPPIPAAPRRQVMVQLSLKAPLHLVERLERMNVKTGAQKQAIIAAALDAYLAGHGY